MEKAVNRKDQPLRVIQDMKLYNNYLSYFYFTFCYIT